MFKSKPFRIVAYILASTLLVLSLTFSFITLSPVDVLQNWSQQTVEQPANGQLPTFQEGDTVKINTTSNKIRDIDGERTVYIDCIQDGIENRYNVSTASVGRELGQKTSEISYIIPYGISNLPQTCHFSTFINYNVYGIRDHEESVKTNDFIVMRRNPTQTVVTNNTTTETRITEGANADQSNSPSPQTPATPTVQTNDEQNNSTETKQETVVQAKVCIPFTGICLLN